MDHQRSQIHITTLADTEQSILTPTELCCLGARSALRTAKSKDDRLSQWAVLLDHAPSGYAQVGGEDGNFILEHRELVLARRDQVGELTCLDRPPFAFVVGEPGDVLGPYAQCRLSVEQIAPRYRFRPLTILPLTIQNSDTQGL